MEYTKKASKHSSFTVEVVARPKPGPKGVCPYYEDGDRIIFGDNGTEIKGKICYSALPGLISKVYPLKYGLDFPWLEDKDAMVQQCPDPLRPVIFEIRRLRQK